MDEKKICTTSNAGNYKSGTECNSNNWIFISLYAGFDAPRETNVPLNLSSKECSIWSPARSLEQESLFTNNSKMDFNFIQPLPAVTTVARKTPKDCEKSEDTSKIFPVSYLKVLKLRKILFW